MDDGMQHLLEATELDPSLISAQVDLAHLCATQELYGFLSPRAASKHIRRICDSMPGFTETAPALLPILGWLHFHVDRDLDRALECFSASAHLPHDPSTTRVRAMFALSRRRFDEALDWLHWARIADPYAPWLLPAVAWTLHLAGHQEKSLEAVEKALAHSPHNETTLLSAATILAYNGHGGRGASLAQEFVRRVPYFDLAGAIHAYALACAGRRDEAMEMVERLQWLSRERYVLRSFTGAAFAALGATDEAIAELKAADEARCPWFFQMLADPRLQPLHGIPAFEKLRAACLRIIDVPADENLEDWVAEPVEKS
jgi:tetratricopeptide (TPR) repeat protein